MRISRWFIGLVFRQQPLFVTGQPEVQASGRFQRDLVLQEGAEEIVHARVGEHFEFEAVVDFVRRTPVAAAPHDRLPRAPREAVLKVDVESVAQFTLHHAAAMRAVDSSSHASSIGALIAMRSA